jgi:hypothetical protein
MLLQYYGHYNKPSSPHFDRQAFQIGSLRMVQSLAQALAYCELSPGVAGRLLHHALEARASYMKRSPFEFFPLRLWRRTSALTGAACPRPVQHVVRRGW